MPQALRAGGEYTAVIKWFCRNKRSGRSFQLNYSRFFLCSSFSCLFVAHFVAFLSLVGYVFELQIFVFVFYILSYLQNSRFSVLRTDSAYFVAFVLRTNSFASCYIFLNFCVFPMIPIGIPNLWLNGVFYEGTR